MAKQGAEPPNGVSDRNAAVGATEAGDEAVMAKQFYRREQRQQRKG
jgi:hypothetical protein